MYIECLNIQSFGSLKNYSCSFSQGINIIEGRNEAGKSTLASFIKFIFYGLSSKSVSKGISEKRRYQNWEDDCAAGSLNFRTETGHYRIERAISHTKGNSKDNIKIIDLNTNTQIAEDVLNPGLYFFGVEEEFFVQTAFVSQLVGSRVDGQSVSAAIENMLFSGSEALNTKVAQKKLDEARIMLLHKNRKGGRVYDLEEQINELDKRKWNAISDSERVLEKRANLKDLQKQLEENKKDAIEYDDRIDRYEAKTLLDKYDAYRALEAELEDKKANKQALIDDFTYEGFLPDDSYIASLKSLDAEMDFINGEIKRCESEKEKLGEDRIDSEDITVLESLEAEGGISGLKEKMSLLFAKKKNAKLLGGFFTLFAIIWAAIGAVCIVFGSPKPLFDISSFEVGFLHIGIAVIVFGCLFLIFGIVFYAKAARFGKEYDMQLAKYEVGDEEALYQALEGCISRQKLQYAYIEEVRAIDKMLLEHLERYNRKDREAAALLEKWGRTYEGREDIDTTVSTVQNFNSSVVDIDMDIYRLEAQYEMAKKNVEGFDIDDVKAVYDRTERYGDISEVDYRVALNQSKIITDASEILINHIREEELELARLDATAENPAQIATEIECLNKERAELSKKHDAYLLANTMLDKASVILRNSIAPKLSMQASTLMRRATSGKYENIGVSNDLSMQYGVSELSSGYVTREMDYMSAGTKDLAYVALRIALINLLYSKTSPFLVFDESFSRVDDERFKNMLSIVNEYTASGAQVFILTSQKRDSIIADEAKISSNIIRL